jgi:hypothetical protein
MKNLILLIVVMLMANYSNAQLRQLTWYKTGIFGNSYTTENFGVCGSPGTKTFKVSYSQCPNLIGVNCIGGCGANPIRYTVQLQRNGVTISTQSFQASSDWSNTFFYNTTASAATYRAYVKVERRKSGCIFGWQTVSTGYTNTVTASTTGATPNFNVDGIAVPASGYITTCISNIKINAAATTCEKDYYVGVQESDQWWNRTLDYEWGGWISGQAPNNINLQGLATTFGIGSRYRGTNLGREGSILIGGNLPSGQARYYRVSICTGVPSWQCKSALIRVNSGCRIDPSTIIEDTNEYTWVENDELAQQLKDENIKAYFEADVEENANEGITAFETKVVSNISIAPNPFSGSTLVSIDNYEGESPILFELYNTLGERVQSIQTSKTQFELQRNQLSAGIYMYRATVDNQLLGSGKVVIE